MDNRRKSEIEDDRVLLSSGAVQKEPLDTLKTEVKEEDGPGRFISDRLSTSEMSRRNGVAKQIRLEERVLSQERELQEKDSEI